MDMQSGWKFLHKETFVHTGEIEIHLIHTIPSSRLLNKFILTPI
jgi:hypothetical protein